MHKTVEAIIDKDGRVRLLEPLAVEHPTRALVTVLEERSLGEAGETALLSEAALSEDWKRDEEDDAWQHLQP